MIVAPTLAALRRALPPKGAFASWDGPATLMAPTLAALMALRP
jgi:hypothetical protein